jgi:hypothetical protein
MLHPHFNLGREGSMSKTVWEEQLNIVNQFVIYLSQIAIRRGDFAAGPCCGKKKRHIFHAPRTQGYRYYRYNSKRRGTPFQ